MISSVLEENSDTSYIYYQPNIISKSVQDEIYNWLECMDDFKEGNIGSLKIDRLQKWYQTENKYFSKDWRVEYDRWKSHDYCENLLKYQNMIQQIVNTICKKHSIKIPNINSCLINMYRDGNDIIKRHSDNQTVFGENPTSNSQNIETREELEVIFFSSRGRWADPQGRGGFQKT